MKVIVCGGRTYSAQVVERWLDIAAASELGGEITCVVHGGAAGADFGARLWAEHSCVPSIQYPANWKKHGRAAGPKRNQQMLDEQKPDAVIAFPGGRGTADMVRRAHVAGVRVVEVA